MQLNRLALACSLGVSVWVGAGARANLIHRYSFNDGTAKDSVGAMDAQLKGEAKIADGKLVLPGGSTSDAANASYLDFAGRVLPDQGSATVEAWFVSNGTGKWSRLFDFGDSDNNRTSGFDYLYFGPHSSENRAFTEISRADLPKPAPARVLTKPLDNGKPHMIAVTVDAAEHKIHLYVDGKEVGNTPLGPNGIEHVSFGNNWIGRSNVGRDPTLTGSVDEFRIYDTALDKDQIAADNKAGPDSVTEPPASKPASAPATTEAAK